MSDNEDDRTTYKTVVLHGPDNFAQWELSVGSSLLGKGLVDCVSTDIPSSLSAKERLRYGKAFALLIQSLSAVVQQSLSAVARTITAPNPKLIWDEVRAQYSAAVGSRQAALIQDMWRRQIDEGDDPMPHLGRIRSAHAQINAGGDDHLSDRMLAYAMTLALPASFATIQQNLWLRSPLSSAEVAGAIQAEWARRKLTDESSNALFAKQKQSTRPNRDFAAADKTKLFGPDQNAFCTEHKAFGHDTSKCHRLHGRPTRTSANISSTAESSNREVSTAHYAKFNNESDSESSAFISTTNIGITSPSGDPKFVIDCGASDHMVTSGALLNDLYSIPNRQIVYGNKIRLSCVQAGKLTLGNVVFHHVLVVPGSGSNLISVCKTPVSHKWDIDQATGVANLYD